MTRLSININQEAAAFYRGLRAKGVSTTEAVRRATAVYKAVLDHMERGGTVILRDSEGRDAEMVLL